MVRAIVADCVVETPALPPRGRLVVLATGLVGAGAEERGGGGPREGARARRLGEGQNGPSLARLGLVCWRNRVA